MSYLAFALGTMAGAVLFLSGIGKLFAAERATARAWVPDVVGRRAALVGIWSVGLAETLVALTGCVPMPAFAAVSGAALLGILLTVYGILALRALGSCGCGGAVPDVFTLRALLLRNGALFGALLVGAVLGPTAADVETNPAGYAVAAIGALYASLAAAVVAQVASRLTKALA